MLILSRHQALVATSVVVSVFVAGASVWLRHVLSETGVATSFLFVFDVATARRCRDLLFCAIVVTTAY